MGLRKIHQGGQPTPRLWEEEQNKFYRWLPRTDCSPDLETALKLSFCPNNPSLSTSHIRKPRLWSPRSPSWDAEEVGFKWTSCPSPQFIQKRYPGFATRWPWLYFCLCVTRSWKVKPLSLSFLIYNMETIPSDSCPQCGCVYSIKKRYENILKS